MVDDPVYCRLDIYFIFARWEEGRGRIKQEALSRITFDHCHIILDSNLVRCVRSHKRGESMLVGGEI